MKTNSQIDWNLWIKWVAATGIAFLGNGVLQLVFFKQSIPVYYFEGFVVAIFQWLFVLRSLHKDAQKWILISGIGWALGAQFGILTSIFIVNLIIHGLIVGIFQWVFFLRKSYSKAYLWVLINTISWLVTVELIWLVPLPSGKYEDPFSVTLVHAIVQGIIYGAMTGAGLLWLSLHTSGEIKPLASSEEQKPISIMGLPVFRYISATLISTVITIVANSIFDSACRLSNYQGNLFFIFIASWISWVGMTSFFLGKGASTNILGTLMSLVIVLVGAYFCIGLTGFWIAPVCN
jgi:hypothetical protein